MKELIGQTVCIVDTETNGFPSYGGQMLSIAWKIVRDFPNNPEPTVTRFIKGREVRLTHIHGITEEIIKEHGVDIDTVLDEFEEVLAATTVVIMHNARFDNTVILNERPRLRLNTVCSMRDGEIIVFVGARNRLGHRKAPSLIEFHTRIFGVPPVVSHSADADVNTLYECLARFCITDDHPVIISSDYNLQLVPAS